jgi:hypothetical protein
VPGPCLAVAFARRRGTLAGRGASRSFDCGAGA